MSRDYKFGDILVSNPFFGRDEDRFLIFNKTRTPEPGLSGNKFDIVGTRVYIMVNKVAIDHQYETYGHFYTHANPEQVNEFIHRLAERGYKIVDGDVVREDIKSLEELVATLKSEIKDKRILKAIDEFIKVD